MPEQASPNTWRHRLRFGVRMMLFIVIVMVLCGGLWWFVRRARVQGDAVAAIRKAGGIVRYDWQSKNGLPIWCGKPWAPDWLVDLVGVDYFGNVTFVYLPGPVSDAGIAHILRLGHVEDLSLPLSMMNDSMLGQLTSLTRLKTLNLTGSSVTDSGLGHLKELTNLQQLILQNTRVTDAGLVHLKGLSSLKYLGIRSTNIARAASVAELRDALPGLRIDH